MHAIVLTCSFTGVGVQNVSITVVLSHCSDATFTVENVNEITRENGLCTSLKLL